MTSLATPTASSLTAQTTVGELVAQRPARAAIFERFGIDYCCGGKRPLDEACTAQGLDTQAVLAALAAAEAAPGGAAEADFQTMTFTALTRHIEQTHHAYLKQELPRLAALAQRVLAAHGPGHAELADLVETVAAFQAELLQHMMKEEQILFPMLRELDAAAARPQFHCGSVGNPIRVMEFEHDSAGQAMERMRRLTGNFTPPPDACNTWRVLLDGLQRVTTDMHQHVHKENNILFPRALQAEARLASA